MMQTTNARQPRTRKIALGAFSMASAAAIAFAALATLAPAPTQSTATASALASGVFNIDDSHSSLLFRTKYMDSSYFFGRFNEIKGSYKLDPNNLSESFIKLTVNVDKVDTGAQGRDRHLRSADFFNVAQFSEATFESTSITLDGDDKDEFIVTGNFTLRGVTKQITTEVEIVGSAPDQRAQTTRMGIYAEFEIDRTDFEVNYGVPALSDKTKIIVSLTGLEQK